LTTVVRRRGESIEGLLKRFRKAVNREKTMTAVRRKRWQISKGERERLKKRKGIQRARRRERRKLARLARRRRRRR
jgi:small subunit ribosomal protein S21